MAIKTKNDMIAALTPAVIFKVDLEEVSVGIAPGIIIKVEVSVGIAPGIIFKVDLEEVSVGIAPGVSGDLCWYSTRHDI